MRSTLKRVVALHLSITATAFAVEDISIFDGSEVEVTKSPTNSTPAEITEDTQNSPGVTEEPRAEQETAGASEESAGEADALEEESPQEGTADEEEGVTQEDDEGEPESSGAGEGLVESELEEFIPTEQISADAGVTFPADI